MDLLTSEPLKGADGLVLDMRGRWGGAPPDATDLFVGRSPTDGRHRPRRRRRASLTTSWRKPVVGIIDERIAERHGDPRARPEAGRRAAYRHDAPREMCSPAAPSCLRTTAFWRSLCSTCTSTASASRETASRRISRCPSTFATPTAPIRNSTARWKRWRRLLRDGGGETKKPAEPTTFTARSRPREKRPLGCERPFLR